VRSYDVIVIGAGVGLSIAFWANAKGLKVALIDKGQVGGTCVNVGCVPSKILIHHADRIVDLEEIGPFGIEVMVKRIDFAAIMERMKATVNESRDWMIKEIEQTAGLDFYPHEAGFIGDSTLDVNGEKLKGQKIFIVSGARPLVPPIRDLDTVSYLSNESLLGLRQRPSSLIIIGGGYIGVEYAHFFAAMGTKVTVIQGHQRLLPNEEPEIAEFLKQALSRRMDILTGREVIKVQKKGQGCAVTVKDPETGDTEVVSGARILVATGRISNADRLAVGRAGVETNSAGYIQVDDKLQTSRRNVWALGDAIGRQMFTHAGDMERRIAWHNAMNPEKITMNFGVTPHAVFTRPQIASVGLTEAQALKDHDILIGRGDYTDVVMGDAMMQRGCFAKAVVDKKTRKILGFHMIGAEAAILIQEVANAMARGGDAASITDCMHVFPALSEIIPETLKNLE